MSKGLRLDRLLSNSGLCARSDVPALIKAGRITLSTPGDLKITAATHFQPEDIHFDGQALDPLELNIVLNKPAGYTCSHRDEGSLIFELMPVRFYHRNPKLSVAGRLDKDTTGLLILTTNGEFLHKLTSPKNHVPKKYFLKTVDPLQGNEAEVFASGTMMLNEEETPLLPAEFKALDSHSGELILHEGRYHQVKRMFAALGNKVDFLRRIKIGEFCLPEDLAEGSYRFLETDEIAQLLKN